MPVDDELEALEVEEMLRIEAEERARLEEIDISKEEATARRMEQPAKGWRERLAEQCSAQLCEAKQCDGACLHNEDQQTSFALQMELYHITPPNQCSRCS